jgi:hypothetical protein
MPQCRTKTKKKIKKQNLRLIALFFLKRKIGVVALSLFVLAFCECDNEQITFSAAFFFFFPPKRRKKKRKAGSISQVQILKKKEPKQLFLIFLFLLILKMGFLKKNFYFFGSLT